MLKLDCHKSDHKVSNVDKIRSQWIVLWVICPRPLNQILHTHQSTENKDEKDMKTNKIDKSVSYLPLLVFVDDFFFSHFFARLQWHFDALLVLHETELQNIMLYNSTITIFQD